MKAMVFCAGYGSRLGDLTRETPKPMLDLCGRPMLEWILAHLRTQGFDEVVVNLHFKPEIIRGHFGDGSRLGMRLRYTEEPQLLGTAGGVRNAASLLRGDEPFLVQYGDVVTDQDFGALMHFHRERSALVTLLVHQRAKSNSIVMIAEDGRVTSFLERPDEVSRRAADSPWVNSGICVCAPEVLNLLPEGVADLPRDVFPKLVASGRLFAMPLSGFRCAVDSPERLALVRSALAEKRCNITGR